MIAVDTNILVYAHRIDSDWHERARPLLIELMEQSSPWGSPWHCLHEFLRVVTAERTYKDPTPVSVALKTLHDWISAPSFSALSEGPDYLETLSETVVESKISGPRIYDASIAAVCLDHGVRELWTADRDFTRFPQLKTRNPLVG